MSLPGCPNAIDSLENLNPPNGCRCVSRDSSTTTSKVNIFDLFSELSPSKDFSLGEPQRPDISPRISKCDEDCNDATQSAYERESEDVRILEPQEQKK
jgi:hypothetical protein